MTRSLTRRVPFFVTMLTAALILVGWGVASAGPCIPDGQTCRTDQSCCSGVCVKSSKKSFGTCNATQCCVQSSPMGAFETCTVETPAQCAAQGGIAQGSGTCSPNPCPPSTTSTSTTTTTTSSCPPATAAYCGGADCGEGGMPGCPPFPSLCPQGMTCTTTGTSCACTGDSIPCGDPRLSGLTCNFCKWGTCPPGMTCGGVPKNGECGFDCACH
jgi:hypothetical protein